MAVKILVCFILEIYIIQVILGMQLIVIALDSRIGRIRKKKKNKRNSQKIHKKN